MESKLKNLKPKKLSEPLRIVIYGAEGSGKSTLAADMPAPIFLDLEGGSGHLDVVRYPFIGGSPRSYQDIIAAIDEIDTEHDFRTLVLDTVDALEPLIWDHCASRSNLAESDMRSYGRGAALVLDEWHRLIVRLDRLRLRQQLAICLIGHSTIRPYKNPIGEDYDRIRLRIADKAGGLLTGYADLVGYLAAEEFTAKLGGADRSKKGVSTGRRILHLARCAAFDAKTRLPLPDLVAVDVLRPWSAILGAIAQTNGESTTDTTIALIAAEVARIGDPGLGQRVSGAMEKASQAQLLRYLQDLRSRPALEAAP